MINKSPHPRNYAKDYIVLYIVFPFALFPLGNTMVRFYSFRLCVTLRHVQWNNSEFNIVEIKMALSFCLEQ